MATFTSQISILFLQLAFATTFICLTISTHHKPYRCNEKDQEILLIFKKGIIDHFGRLSTWSTDKDCCAWKGVQCNNITGKVTELHLSAPNFEEELEGEINFIFLELEFLNYLDLSENNFTVTSILHNLSHASHLRYLDLSYNEYLHMDNLHWLSQLSSLKYLNLTEIDLHKKINWLQDVAMFPSLLDLRLGECNLGSVSPFLNYVNFTSLVTLDLSGNNFNSELPKGLFNFTGEISYLDLSMSNINGEIPSNLLSLRKLTFLRLSSNRLTGSIPDLIGQLEHLQYLDISFNMFSGSVPSTLGNLSSLFSLEIGYNNFSGVISQTTFSKLSNLEILDMGNSTFAFQLGPEWVPPFQLVDLYLENTNQGPNFPSWIYTQNSLDMLGLSRTGISLAGGNKFWSFVEGISSYLNLSNNSMSGDISYVTLNTSDIRLDYNNFTGRLPCISSMVTSVDFSYNSFSGSIPHCLEKMANLRDINLWSNRLSGELLDLSNLNSLLFLNLGKNKLSGTIPVNLPQSLEVIVLRANHFEGNIPPQLFNLSSLFHMDIAHNKLSGSIPQCAYNMTQMVTTGSMVWSINTNIVLFTKGQEYYWYEADAERRTIDLSSNNFSGEIPSELFRLIQVQTLNLSHNNLTGIIPNQIGEMKCLESLDLSNNELFGEIPQSMAALTFLEYLNLSCNNFVGQIPIGPQLQTFEASSYTGNLELCGEPLQKCFKEEKNHENAKPTSTWNQDDDDQFRESLYQGMGVGFATGFWGIWGSLFLIRKWRHTCFRFFDRVNDKIYVALMVKLNKIRKA